MWTQISIKLVVEGFIENKDDAQILFNVFLHDTCWVRWEFKKKLNILEDGMLVPFEFLCPLNTLEYYEKLFMKKMKHPF